MSSLGFKCCIWITFCTRPTLSRFEYTERSCVVNVQLVKLESPDTYTVASCLPGEPKRAQQSHPAARLLRLWGTGHLGMGGELEDWILLICGHSWRTRKLHSCVSVLTDKTRVRYHQIPVTKETSKGSIPERRETILRVKVWEARGTSGQITK